jgi:hypothetical protein
VDVAVRLAVPLQQVRQGLNVIIANGDKLPCRGFCRGLDVMVGAEPFRLPRFSLELGGCNLILGTHWLLSFEPILWDFARLSMTCFIDGRRVYWQGEPGRAPASCRQIQGEELLEHLLGEFADLYSAPISLPPQRHHDHNIHLETRAQPVGAPITLSKAPEG